MTLVPVPIPKAVFAVQEPAIWTKQGGFDKQVLIDKNPFAHTMHLYLFRELGGSLLFCMWIFKYESRIDLIAHEILKLSMLNF